MSANELYQVRLFLIVRNKGDQELWIAARIPEEFRSNVSVSLAGATYSIPQRGVSSYGDGYKWYQLGTVNLAGQNSALSIHVNAMHGADVGIDAIVLYPGTFRPNGVQMPLVPEVKIDPTNAKSYLPSKP